jgi:hypothetical protein
VQLCTGVIRFFCIVGMCIYSKIGRITVFSQLASIAIFQNTRPTVLTSLDFLGTFFEPCFTTGSSVAATELTSQRLEALFNLHFLRKIITQYLLSSISFSLCLSLFYLPFYLHLSFLYLPIYVSSSIFFMFYLPFYLHLSSLCSISLSIFIYLLFVLSTYLPSSIIYLSLLNLSSLYTYISSFSKFSVSRFTFLYLLSFLFFFLGLFSLSTYVHTSISLFFTTKLHAILSLSPILLIFLFSLFFDCSFFLFL